MNTIINTLSTWLDKNVAPHHKLLVAYSGGRDSHVLLDVLVKLKSSYSFTLSAIHINHGLQEAALSWAKHCQRVCDAYAVPLSIVNLELTILPGESLEDKARNARYKAFAKHMDSNTILLTAHTQDDQAETFLLQMMRGSGIKGLAAIAPHKILAKGLLARPLLTVSRDEIAQFATANQLLWIEDPSNENVKLRRNFIRKNILRPLDTVQVNTSQCIARSAQHCQQALTLLEDYLTADLAQCLGHSPLTLKVDALIQRSFEKQSFILRLWLSEHQIKLPPMTKCHEMLRQLLTAAKDANPEITWGQWQLRRYQQLIYLLKVQPEIDLTQQWQWNLQQPLTLSDGCTWQAQSAQGRGVSLAKLHHKQITVAYRQGGERCILPKQTNSKPVKKLLQEMKIPPWQRKTLPLFYLDDALIAVADLFISKDWQVNHPEETGLCFEKVKS